MICSSHQYSHKIRSSSPPGEPAEHLTVRQPGHDRGARGEDHPHAEGADEQRARQTHTAGEARHHKVGNFLSFQTMHSLTPKHAALPQPLDFSLVCLLLLCDFYSIIFAKAVLGTWILFELGIKCVSKDTSVFKVRNQIV